MKKFLKSPWTISIVSTLFGSVLTIIYDIFKGKKILSTLLNILCGIWNFIISVLNFELKLWWVLLGIALLILVLWIVVKIKEFGEEGPEFLRYTKDTIQGWAWEWTWCKNYEGKYVVDDLHPVCESCGTPLAAKHDYQSSLYCVRCGWTRPGFGVFPDLNHIELYIVDTAKRKSELPKE